MSQLSKELTQWGSDNLFGVRVCLCVRVCILNAEETHTEETK